MFVEGKGYTIPQPVRIFLSQERIRETGQRIAHFNRSWNKSPRSLVGFCGETASALFWQLKLKQNYLADFRVKVRGDGGTDQTIFDLELQIKTITRPHYNLRVPRYNLANDQIQPLQWKADVYVLIDGSEFDPNGCYFSLIGWVWQSDLVKHGVSKKEYDQNILELEQRYLYPMQHLVITLENRKGIKDGSH